MTKNRLLIIAILFCITLVSSVTIVKGDESKTPIELGKVDWSRNFDTALEKAKQEDKPILILFQEVPGCATCRNYGTEVLSHPLIRDAAEHLFVPVAIYNNIEGADRKVLESFKEPTWNNPVVRIVRHDRKPLAERVSGDFSLAGLASAMVDALKADKKSVPKYLSLLADESNARKRGLEKATFAMHCFWEGEVNLGALDGVYQTQPGWLGGEEVVDVWFDPKAIGFDKLLTAARTTKCASRVYARSEAQKSQAEKQIDAVKRDDTDSRPDKEPKYYLGKSTYRFIPMTSAQVCRVNAALRDPSKSPDDFLSPSQIELHSAIKKNPNAKWPVVFDAMDIISATEKCQEIRRHNE